MPVMSKLRNWLKSRRQQKKISRMEQLFGKVPTISGGPFKGVKYYFPNEKDSSIRQLIKYAIVTKLVGIYEEPIHDWINEVPGKNYARIINIGSAEGYFAVGFALKNAAEAIFAFDICEGPRLMLEKLAKLNQVQNQIEIRTLCDEEQLQKLSGSKTLVFCDIEGGEADLLDPVKVPNLKSSDLIVETHDCIRQGVTNLLIERFRLTHRIEVQSDTERQWKNYTWPTGFNDRMKRGWTNEGRPKGMLWLRMTSLSS
jgi:hypothetical protein